MLSLSFVDILEIVVGGNMEETRLNIRISPDKKDALQAKAKQDGKTITEVISSLIDQYLGVNPLPIGEIVELKQRLEKLEKEVRGSMGETAAWEKKTKLSGNNMT